MPGFLTRSPRELSRTSLRIRANCPGGEVRNPPRAPPSMPSRVRLRLNRSRSSLLRRAILGLVLMSYLAASQGWIISPTWPLRLASVSSAERYPCEDCSCGCASARECWTNCCCHTLPERLAWAVRNGVRPPPYVHTEESDWIAALDQVEPSEKHCSLCVGSAQDRLARGEGIACARTDCKGTKGACPSCVRPRPTTAFGLSALRCKSLAQILAFAPVAGPRPVTELHLPKPMQIGLMPLPADQWASSRPLDAPEPPPRTV